jgi:hypothetical protein
VKRLALARVLVVVVAASSAALALGTPSSPQALRPSGPEGSWFKGNLHTHTLNSDGDSTPDDVVRWYREHGYNFVVITDHNYLTNVDGLNALHAADAKFLVLRGEEVTDRHGEKPLHVNGFGVERLILPTSAMTAALRREGLTAIARRDTVVQALQEMVDSIRGANGVPSINHPNYGWAITPDELGQVQRTKLFEVFNGHPLVNNLGGGGVPGLEETWDRILSSGKLLYGIAVDDAHVFKRPEDKTTPRPGFGWVFVRAARLEPRMLIEALERGEFYSSTGVVLQSLVTTATAMTVTVATERQSKYRIQFIGRQGRVLSETTASPATYTFTGDEGYVRAKVIESNGKLAWIQPVPVGSSAPK